MILAAVLQAIGLFIATNIDDIIVLSLFFARGAGQRGTTTRILVGQYVGFACILGAAVLVTIGAGAFLPSAAIPGPFPLWWRVGHIPRVPELGRNRRWDRHGGHSPRSTKPRR